MFQIGAQMQESDLAPTAALKGLANCQPQRMPPSTYYATGTLVFVKFSGTPDGRGSYIGHLHFDIVDEPLPNDKQADFSRLMDFANSVQAIDVTGYPEQSLADSEQELEPESELTA